MSKRPSWLPVSKVYDYIWIWYCSCVRTLRALGQLKTVCVNVHICPSLDLAQIIITQGLEIIIPVQEKQFLILFVGIFANEQSFINLSNTLKKQDMEFLEKWENIGGVPYDYMFCWSRLVSFWKQNTWCWNPCCFLKPPNVFWKFGTIFVSFVWLALSYPSPLCMFALDYNQWSISCVNSLNSSIILRGLTSSNLYRGSKFNCISGLIDDHYIILHR